MRLKESVVVVTGAASGMGRALCQELGRAGARLGLLDRDAAGLDSLAGELEAEGVLCALAVADVRDRAAVREAIHRLADRLGPIDVLAACAGITGATLVEDLAVPETEAILEVNFLGVAHAIDAVLPGMLARGRGQIVALASLAGCRGVPFSAGYCASKAALINYLEALRPALRRRGVFVTTVLPGFVRTPLLENARVRAPVAAMEPGEAARHIVRAIRKKSRVYAFPTGTRLGIALLGWLPPALYDWCMVRGAARIPDVPY
jgi:short-subunit dehydrogenase